MLNTYIYHKLPPTCFGVCYAIFWETIELLAQKLYAFCNVAVKYTIYRVFFLIYNAVTLFKTIRISSLRRQLTVSAYLLYHIAEFVLSALFLVFL